MQPEIHNELFADAAVFQPELSCKHVSWEQLAMQLNAIFPLVITDTPTKY